MTHMRSVVYSHSHSCQKHRMSARNYVKFDIACADQTVRQLENEMPKLRASTKNLKKMYLAAKDAEDQAEQALCAAKKKRDGLAALLSGGVFDMSGYDPEELTSESLRFDDYFIVVNVDVVFDENGFHRIVCVEVTNFDDIKAQITNAFPGAAVWFTEAELADSIEQNAYSHGFEYDRDDGACINKNVRVKVYHFTLGESDKTGEMDGPLAKRPKYYAYSV